MKKSIKKYLIMLVAIVAILTTALVVSAEEIPYCSDCKNSNTDVGKTFAPTCETPGYTELLCSDCKKVIGKKDIQNILSHEYDEVYEKSTETSTYYEKLKVCKNCQNRTKPEPGVKYYKVTFYNPFETNGDDHYEDDCPYANLVDADDPDAYTTKELYSDFIKEGSLALYDGVCVRESDKTFNTYELEGWVSESKIINDDKTDFGIIDTRVASRKAYNAQNVYTYVNKDLHEAIFGNGSDKEVIFESKHGFKIPLKDDVRADYNFYAVFKAINKTHTVEFLTAAGSVQCVVKDIMHGDAAEFDYNKYGVPTKTPNYQVYYTFTNEWTYNKKGFEYKVDLDNIYASITVSPKFEMKSQTYLFKYLVKDMYVCTACNFEGNVGSFKNEQGKMVCTKCTTVGKVEAKAYTDANGNAVTDIVAIAGPQKGEKTTGNGRKIDVQDYYDARNLYIYTGYWKIRDRTTAFDIDIKNPNLPYDVKSYEETGGAINLVPSFKEEARVYNLPIRVVYPHDENDDNHPSEIDIQVTNAEGGLVRSVTLTSAHRVDSKPGEADTYAITLSGVKYSSSYKVSAKSKTYFGVDVAYFSYPTNGSNAMSDYKPNTATVYLKHDLNEDCNCICHTVLKPIWVAALNLLNTLFKVEYICCDDMFANIGDRLNYGK